MGAAMRRTLNEMIERAALAVAQAENCGIGDEVDGKWVRRLCDDQKHVPDDLLISDCSCRRAARVVLETIGLGQQLTEPK